MRAAPEPAIAGRTRIATTRSGASLARRGIALTDNWGVEHITRIFLFFPMRQFCNPILAFLNLTQYNLTHPPSVNQPPTPSLNINTSHIYTPAFAPECDEYIRIFEYFWSKYLFGYSFVSFFGYKYIRIFVRVNFLDTNIFGYLFVAKFWYKCIRIFVRINFQDTNRFRRCFCWFSLDIIPCLWIFCWYQWSKMPFRL